MSTYIISDIHGCYNEFLSMLAKINFSAADQLILAGDYIDRGKHSYEMLKWIEHAPANVQLIRGNHEEEFAAYVELMCQLDQKVHLETDFSSNEDTIILYETVKYFIRYKGLLVSCFDMYGTIRDLLDNFNVTLNELCRWADIIRQMPYYYELEINHKTCIVVHAGYVERLADIGSRFSRVEQFYLYAREESCQFGGRQHAIIIAGHTPTIVKGEFAYHAGKVFRYYDEAKDCVFYDIDCGCVFRSQEPDAKLACIRLEDEKIFYI